MFCSSHLGRLRLRGEQGGLEVAGAGEAILAACAIAVEAVRAPSAAKAKASALCWLPAF